MLAITISEDKLTLDDGVTEIITRIDSESPKKMQGYVDHLNNSRKISEAIPIDDEHPIVKFAVENGVTDAVAKVQASVESWRGLARMDAVLLTLMLANFSRSIAPGVGVVATPKFPVEVTEASWSTDEADADAIMTDQPPSPRRDRNNAVEQMITAIYAMLDANPKLQSTLLEKIQNLTFGGSIANDKDATFPDDGRLEGDLAGTSLPDSQGAGRRIYKFNRKVRKGSKAR